MPSFRVVIFIISSACVAMASSAHSATLITSQGVGPVRLGMLYTDLRSKGLVEPIGPGCEVAGPNTRSAKLRAPLNGSVDFTESEPRRVATVTIFGGGATARGIGVGATSRALKAAFPAAKFDHSSDATFGATFVNIPRGKGGPIGFSVSTKSKRVEQIAVPNISTCD